MARKKRKVRRRPRRTIDQMIADLEEQLAELKDQAKNDHVFSARKVRQERDRLELSAADYGELLGVSAVTIYNWEKGTTRPRRKQLRALESLNGIGKRAAWRRLGID